MLLTACAPVRKAPFATDDSTTGTHVIAPSTCGRQAAPGLAPLFRNTVRGDGKGWGFSLPSTVGGARAVCVVACSTITASAYLLTVAVSPRSGWTLGCNVPTAVLVGDFGGQLSQPMFVSQLVAEARSAGTRSAKRTEVIDGYSVLAYYHVGLGAPLLVATGKRFDVVVVGPEGQDGVAWMAQVLVAIHGWGLVPGSVRVGGIFEFGRSMNPITDVWWSYNLTRYHTYYALMTPRGAIPVLRSMTGPRP